MKKNQIVGFGLGVAMVGVLVGSGCVLTSALSRTEAVARQRDDKRAELGRIYNERVFPSPSHTAMIRKDAQNLADWNAGFVQAQRSILHVETNLSPSQFKIQVLQPTIRELAKKQTDGGSRIVAPDFAFGFDAYVPGDRMPATADIPRLAIQLELTRRLCREVFAANIIALRQIQHAASEGAPASVPLRRKPGGAAAAARPAAEPDDPSRALTGLHPFTLEFTARKDAMLTVLNRLAACDLFVTVKDIDVRKTGSDVKAPPETWRDMGDAHHQQRVVSGPELDPPLLVRLTVEVEIF